MKTRVLETVHEYSWYKQVYFKFRWNDSSNNISDEEINENNDILNETKKMKIIQHSNPL
jgi:hypothetical protein